MAVGGRGWGILMWYEKLDPSGLHVVGEGTRT